MFLLLVCLCERFFRCPLTSQRARFVSLRNMQFTIHRGVRKVTTKNFQFLETSEDNVESAAEDTEDSEDSADEEDLSFEDNEGKKFN